MKLIPTNIPDCIKAVEVPRHFDSRGFFQEVYNEDKYRSLPSPDYATPNVWRQVNWSDSKKNVLRGLHVAPYAKLITCVKGSIYDVVVDMRVASPAYLKWYGTRLDAVHPSQLFVPPWCAHGFVALEDATVMYLQTETYGPDKEWTVRWDEPEIGVMWPVVDPILSDKDAGAKTLKEAGRLSPAYQISTKSAN